MAKAARIAPTDGLSYVRGRTGVPLLNDTIPAFLKRAADTHPDNEIAVFCGPGIRWTYREFLEKVDVLAAGLLALGLYKGDRIGIWSPNRPEWLLAQFATARIGLVLVNINPAYRRSELEYALNKVKAKALITALNFKASNYVGMLRDLAPEMDRARAGQLRSDRLPHLRTVIQMGSQPISGTYTFDEVLKRGHGGQRARLNAITKSLSPFDAINIQFTSGTTGAPKGATLTHHNIINNALFCAQAMDFSPQDRLCIPVPLYHCFGMVLGNLSSTATAATMVFPGEAFDAKETLQAVMNEHCTALHGVPTMFIAMVDYPDFAKFDLRSLRTGIMAGAPCPIELMRRVMNEMHMHQVTIAYGMTETAPISFQSAIDDPVGKLVATVGRIQPHVEAKIIDEDGNTLPVGQQGEFCARGYLVMKGYWDDPERTAETIDAEGWMHSGDLATLDADGYCNIVGRVKDMLIRGGENIYPREIEEYLFGHAAVGAVQIFGVPSEKYGEEICAWIVTKVGHSLTEDDVRDFCDGQIAHFKVPRYIRFVAEMPMTVTGKPQKFRMRETMMAELGLKEAASAQGNGSKVS